MALASQTEWPVTAIRSQLEAAGLRVQRGKGTSCHREGRPVSISAVHRGKRRCFRCLPLPFRKSYVIGEGFTWVTEKHTVVQPDVFVICEPKRKDLKGNFLPDFVAEVVSPSSIKRDYFLKLGKYSNAGVREYWIVIPDSLKVLVYEFEKSDSERPTEYTFADKVPVGIWDGKCEVDFKEIYESIEFLL